MKIGVLTLVMFGAMGGVAAGCGGAQGPTATPAEGESTLEVSPGDATPPAGAAGEPGGQPPSNMGTDPSRSPDMGGEGPAN